MLIIFLSIFISVECSLLQKIVENNVKTSDVCVKNLVADYSKQQEVVVSINNDNIKGIIGHRVYYNYQLKNYSFFINKQYKTTKLFYLVNIDGNAEDLFKFLYMSNQLDVKSTFILKIYKQDIEILEILHRFYIQNVIFIRLDTDNLQIMQYTQTKENKLHYTHLGNCDKLLKSNEILKPKFSKRKFENVRVLAGIYPPYVYNDKYTGISNKVVNLALEKLGLNVTYTFQEIKIDSYIFKDNFTGIWKMLLEGPYDMFAGLVVPEGTEMGYFEQTFSPLEDSSYFAVPYLLEDVERLSIFRIFTTHLWIVIFLILIILGLQFYYIMNILKLDRKYTKLEIGFIIFRSLLEVPNFKRPNTTSLKILFTVLLYFITIMSNCYKSKLFNSSVNENPRQVYGTIEDIVNKKLNVGLHYVASRTMIKSNNFYEKYLAEHSNICRVDSACLNKTAFEKNFATAKLEKSINYLLPRYYIGEDGTPLIYILKNYKLNTVFFNYFFKMGHPLYDKFNEYLMIIKENGFVDDIYKNINAANNLIMMQRHKKIINVPPLKLSEIFKVFLLYAICVGVSFIVFCTEHFYHYRNNYLNN